MLGPMTATCTHAKVTHPSVLMLMMLTMIGVTMRHTAVESYTICGGNSGNNVCPGIERCNYDTNKCYCPFNGMSYDGRWCVASAFGTFDDNVNDSSIWSTNIPCQTTPYDIDAPAVIAFRVQVPSIIQWHDLICQSVLMILLCPPPPLRPR
jgi:hypothetical protein